MKGAGAPEPRIDDRLRSLFGPEPFALDGVVHVVSAWSTPPRPAEPAAPATGSLFAIRIGPGSPRSVTDAFVLSAVRARADVVLTTGRILREEPRLQHGYATECARELARWRVDGGGRDRALPRSAVLTRGENLPLDHPIFARRATRNGRQPILLSSAATCLRLADWAREHGVELCALDEPGPRAALEALRAGGASTIAVEAGPSTANALYEAPLAIDELVLSTWLEATLAPELRGAALPARERLDATLPYLCGVAERSEESGRWRFERRLRKRPR